MFAYHETQWLSRCAVHAVNNLFQASVTSSREFDEVCAALAPDARWLANPHRTPLLGNYDANALLAVVARHGATGRFVDRRAGLGERVRSAAASPRARGFLVPVRSARRWWRPFASARHWFALVRAADGQSWAVCDSLSSAPLPLGDTAALERHIDALAADAALDLNLIFVEDENDTNDTNDETDEPRLCRIPLKKT